MQIQELTELSIKHSRQELTQREIDRLLTYLFEQAGRIPAEALIKELLEDGEALSETITKLRKHL